MLKPSERIDQILFQKFKPVRTTGEDAYFKLKHEVEAIRIFLDEFAQEMRGKNG